MRDLKQSSAMNNKTNFPIKKAGGIFAQSSQKRYSISQQAHGITRLVGSQELKLPRDFML